MRGSLSLPFLVFGSALAFAGPTATVDTRSGLRLRSGSSANSSIKGAYPRGTKVEILSSQGKWSKVRVQGKTGYMYTPFLKQDPASTAAEEDEPETAAQSDTTETERGQGYVVRARRGLRMRSGPSIRHRIVGTFPNGSRVQVLDKGRHPWWRCSARGKTGYMWHGYLKKLSDGQETGGQTGDRTGGQTGDRTGGQTGDRTGGQTGGADTGGADTGNAGNPTGGSIDTRNLSGLRPGFRAKVERILRRLKSLGWQPRVAEGKRTVAQQREKVRKGYSKTMNSYHLYGLAADIIDRRYAWNISQSHKFWRDLGRAAAAENLTWGGNWTSFKDVAHVQARSRNAN